MTYLMSNFNYKIEDEIKAFEVLGEVLHRSQDFIVTEDGYGENFVFQVDENESMQLVEDESLSEYILNKWNGEHNSSSTADNWSSDSGEENSMDDAQEDNLHIMDGLDEANSEEEMTNFY